MRRELREYLLWSAGYRAGEKPDRSKLFLVRKEPAPLTITGIEAILIRAGYSNGSRPDQTAIMDAKQRMDLERHYGLIPPFPVPLYPVSWRNLVKRSAWGFFCRNCPALPSVGSSETL